MNRVLVILKSANGEGYDRHCLSPEGMEQVTARKVADRQIAKVKKANPEWEFYHVEVALTMLGYVFPNTTTADEEI